VLEKLPEISEVLVHVEPELADKYSASPVSSSSSGPWPEASAYVRTIRTMLPFS
jgi:hypothetical protein